MLIKVKEAFKFTTDRGHTVIEGDPNDATQGVYDVPPAIGNSLIEKGKADLHTGPAPVVETVVSKPVEDAQADPTEGNWKGDAEAGLTDNDVTEDADKAKLDAEKSTATESTEPPAENNAVENTEKAPTGDAIEGSENAVAPDAPGKPEVTGEGTENNEADIVASLDAVIASCKGKEDAEAKALLDDWAMANLEGHIDKRKTVAKTCEELKELVSTK